MSIKSLISNRRGEVASIILIVSMIVTTLGIITGSQAIKKQLTTATQAQSTLGITLQPSTMNFPISTNQSTTFKVTIWGSRAQNANSVIINLRSYSQRTNAIIKGSGTYIKIDAPFTIDPYTGSPIAYVELQGIESEAGTYGVAEVTVTANDGQPSAQSNLQYAIITPPTATPTHTPTPTSTPRPLKCYLEPNAPPPYEGGKNYIIRAVGQGGSELHKFENWKVYAATDNSTPYGSLTKTDGTANYWTAPTNTALGTNGTVYTEIVDISTNQRASCITNLTVTFPPPTATPTPDYNLQMIAPVQSSTHYLPLQLEYRGQILGNSSYNTASVALKLYRYPITTNIPLIESRISNFSQGNGSLNFSGVLSGNTVNTPGEYILQIIPYNQTGTIIGTHKEVRFSLISPPTATPTNTPVPPTPTNTPTATNTPPVPQITCTSLTGTLTGSTLNLNLTVTNGLNPFYYQIQKNGTKISQGASTNASAANISIPNATVGTYQAYVLNTPNGFFQTSDTCKYIYAAAPATNTPTPPPATNTPTHTPTSTPPPASKADLLIESATATFDRSNRLTITSIIKNAGNAAVNFVGTHSVQIDVMKSNSSTSECTSVNPVNIAGLAPNARHTLSLLFSTDVYPRCANFNPVAGTKYIVRLIIDPTNVVAEIDESNNTKTVEFTQPTPIIPTIPPTVTGSTPPPATNTPTKSPTPTIPGIQKPDLIVKTSTHSFNTQNGMTMIAGIQNIGTANVNTGNHLLNIEVKDPATTPSTVLCETTSSIAISNLTPKGLYSHTIYFPTEIYNTCPNFSPVAGKTYKVTLYADIPTRTSPRGTVDESNESNNTRSFNFTQPGGNPPPPTAIPTATPTSPPSQTTTDVKIDITIINPQINYTIWATAQEMTGTSNPPSPIKCSIGDSTKTKTTVTCSQLKRGKTYEFIALAKAAKPNAQTIQSEKNTYIIPGSPNINPQVQNKTLTLPPLSTTATQAPTVPPTNPPATHTPTNTPIPTATPTSNPQYNLEVILPTENSQHYLPLQLEYRAAITGTLASSTSHVDLKLYKYPITTNVPLIDLRISSFNTTNNQLTFSGLLQNAQVTGIGEYALQFIPYNRTGTIIGSPKEVHFNIINVTPTATTAPIPPTATPTAPSGPFTITGRIQYPDGTDGENIPVRLFKYTTNSQRTFIAESVSDFLGTYEFPQLAEGTYDLVPSTTAPQTISPTMHTVVVAPGSLIVTAPLFTLSGIPTLTPTPRGLIAIDALPQCMDVLVTGDSIQKNDVIFLPHGYKDYRQYEADARETISHYRKIIGPLQEKYNFKMYTDIRKGYDVTSCKSKTNNKDYPCWNTIRAKEALRNCNGDEYIILVNTAKPRENRDAAAQDLAKYGGVKGITLGADRGEFLLLRYDLSYIQELITSPIRKTQPENNIVLQFLETILNRFR